MIKTLTVEQLDDVKKVTKYLDRFSNDLVDKIVRWAKNDSAQFFTFADVASCVRIHLGLGEASNVDCFMPIMGDENDLNTLIVTNLFFYVGDKEIDEILRNCNTEMIKRIAFNALENVEACAYHRGFHKTTLDLHDYTGKTCWIVK